MKMKFLFSILLLTGTPCRLMAQCDSLILKDGRATFTADTPIYPVVVVFTNPWQTVALTNHAFSAAEFYRYEIALDRPTPTGLRLCVQNREEADRNTGQTADIQPGTRIIKGEFKPDALEGGDCYVRCFRLQHTDDSTAIVHIRKVVLFDEEDKPILQKPAEGTWNVDN